jgi:hypothetical protein
MRFLLLYDSSSLNVTQYSNAYTQLSVCSQSVVLNHSQMVVWNHSNTVVVSELGWISVCACVRMYVMFVSIWWDLLFLLLLFFCYIFFAISFFLFFFPFSCLLSVRKIVVRSSLLLMILSLVCSKAVIIVIRKIYKFDNDGSVQAYYRLTNSMSMEEDKREDVWVSTRFISYRSNDGRSWHS